MDWITAFFSTVYYVFVAINVVGFYGQTDHYEASII